MAVKCTAVGVKRELKLCPEQELCKYFTVGHKRKAHHIRVTEKCLLWEDGCIEQHDIALGDHCVIEKIKRLKGK